jgi:hypothetical protein
LGVLDDEVATPEARREALQQLRLDLESKWAAYRNLMAASHHNPSGPDPDRGDHTARLANTAESRLEIEMARVDYQDAFTRYMAASDRERERENRLAQGAAERHAMTISERSQREVRQTKWASWAMVLVAAATLLSSWCQHASSVSTTAPRERTDDHRDVPHDVR